MAYNNTRKNYDRLNFCKQY